MVGLITSREMISYYLLVTIVDALTAVNEDDWQIAADIKDGNISQFLLKPINYLAYRLCLFLSGRLTYVSVAAIPLALFIASLHDYFVLPENWTIFGLFLFSTVLQLCFNSSCPMRSLCSHFGCWKFRRSFSSCMLSSTSPVVTCSLWIYFPSRWNRPFLSSFPIPALFPGKHLYGQDDRPRVGHRSDDTIRLGFDRLRLCPVRLGAWHPQVRCCGRMSLHL